MHLLHALGTARVHAHIWSEKEKKVQQIKREGSIIEEGRLYIKIKIPTLPTKPNLSFYSTCTYFEAVFIKLRNINFMLTHFTRSR